MCLVTWTAYGGAVTSMSLGDDQLSAGREAITDAAVAAARHVATRHLMAGMPGLGSSEAEEAVVSALIDRDSASHPWISGCERAWGLLVLQLLAGTLSDLRDPVRDARERGATVAEIAAAIGVSSQAIYSTYAEQVVRKKRSK